MEFNKQLIWLWTHCRAIGMVNLSNVVGSRNGIGSKGMELDIALFTSELVAENVALRKQLSGGLHPPTTPAQNNGTGCNPIANMPVTSCVA